jgi:hypothetical protein
VLASVTSRLARCGYVSQARCDDGSADPDLPNGGPPLQASLNSSPGAANLSQQR